MEPRVQRPPGNGGVGLRPGQVIAGRYRIHRLLGRGAMGEVYRADDLTLGRYVALKFPILDGSAAGRSQRLAAEVAVAQRVSHPNVCRVHELGRHGKRVFLSMQLIEGETLHAVLSRSVGTLAKDEKLRIAHDLCAALAAIHAQGILYRDLKPGNVMLDSDGRALITDFGLAAFGCVSDPGSGTFDYMAPEQHALGEAGEPSVKSDLYALGLVLYEVFVGRPAFCGSSRKELVRLKLEGPPDFPSNGGVEPDVKEVILRSLAPVPDERPASADEVARALPGRPGPGSEGAGEWIAPPETLLVSPRCRPRPWGARVLLAAVGLGLLAVAALAPSSQLVRPAELGDPPQALEVRARDVLVAAGLGGEDRNERYGYGYDARQLDHAASTGDAADRWPRDPAAPVPPVVFWYRQSPRRLVPVQAGSPYQRYDDPPLTVPGMVGVQLDPWGRLLRLDAVPPRVAPPDPSAPELDWRPLFAAAGLDLERFRAVAPAWTPPEFADRRQAWEAPSPLSGGEPIRIEAASFGARPVSFLRVEPWMFAAEPEVDRRTELQLTTSGLGRALAGLWYAGVLIGGILLARKNLFRRVADPRAAFRLAVAVLAARALVWLLGAQHMPGTGELMILKPHLARALLIATEVAIIYLALEPFVRRFRPELTASWVRLVYGRARDPMVGHHLLAGAFFGTAGVLLIRLYATFAGTLGLPPPRLDRLDTVAGLIMVQGLDLQCEALRGFREALAVEILAVVHGVLLSIFGVVGVVVLRLVLKQPILSRTVALALFVGLLFPRAGHPLADLVVATAICALYLAVLLRFGFLAGATAMASAFLLTSHPLTLDLSAWYAPGSTVALLTVLAVALFGFRTSMAQTPVLPREWFRLDEPRPALSPSSD
jgi:serine/threonine-protein kinase